MKVIAQRYFADALTERSYHAGDEVTGWDATRAAHYAFLGLVRVEDAPTPETTATPSETAPAVGPTETATPKGPTKKK